MFFLEIFKSFGEMLKTIGQVLNHTWFIIFPIVFYYLFKTFWMYFVWVNFSNSVEYVLLEIIPPRNIEKSPKPMESVYAGMAGVLKTFNAVEEYVQGMLTPRFSLELVSDEGKAHFYLRTPRMFRNLVESQIYAQYPDAEINEVADYVDNAPRIIPNKDWDLWGTDFELVKPDPYPIKTYKYFEEDITGKMIDPLASLVETIGKLGPKQKIWFQYVIIPEKETWQSTGLELVQEIAGRVKKPRNVFDEILADLRDVFGNIFKAMSGPVEFATKEDKAEEAPLEFRLTPGEKEVLKAVESNIGKNVFKVKMRFIYFGKRENFDRAVVSSFIGGLKQFSDLNLNSFKPNDISKTYANYILADERLRYRQRKIFRRYKDRDPDGVKFILSTEELATIFHLPDMSVVAPGIIHVEAKKGGAPANLPVE